MFGPKEKEGLRPICYYLGVLEEHIRYEVLKKGCCDSLEDIVEFTKAGTGKWWLTTNPSGKCCRDYLPGVVGRYLSMKVACQARQKLSGQGETRPIGRGKQARLYEGERDDVRELCHPMSAW